MLCRPRWAGGVAFSPGVRLHCVSCAPCRVVQCWAQGCTPGTRTDPVQLCPQLLPLGTIQPKVWPRKSWPRPHPSLPGFSHHETVFPSDPAPEGGGGASFQQGAGPQAGARSPGIEQSMHSRLCPSVCLFPCPGLKWGRLVCAANYLSQGLWLHPFWGDLGLCQERWTCRQ